MYSTGSYAPPPPPALANGSIPTRRLQTSVQPEMPSCVQNAMMTKDKKPFTYTPCGIDLSQIKSPRMAKRIQRNANMEGVTNQPKPSPLAQQNNNEQSPRPTMPAGAHGMPVQVFPSGPPPPPPAPFKSQLSAPTNNANRSPSPSRKSPQPQNFEPPPLGCRPEIKIPPNPMATLRKVATPKPKDDFWVEEYRRERSKSPMPGSAEANSQNTSSNQANNDLPNLPEPVCQANVAIQQNNNVPTRNEQINKIDSPQQVLARQTSLKNDFNQNNNFNNFNNNYVNNSHNNNSLGNQKCDSPQQRIYSPFSSSSPTPNLPKPLSPIKLTQDNNVPIYVRSAQRKTSPSPIPANGNNSPHESYQETPSYYVRSHQRPNATPPPPAPTVSTLQKQPSVEQPKSSAPAHPQNIPIYTRPARNVAPSPPTFQKQSSLEQKLQPQVQQRPPHQPQLQYQQQANENVPIYVRSFQNQQRVISPPPANSQQNNGTVDNGSAQPVNQTVPPPWMAKRRDVVDAPEWVNQNENSFQRPAAAPTNGYHQQNTNQNAQNNFGGNHYAPPNNNANAAQNSATNERIVPIQLDQSVTKILTSPAGFTAQPYQNAMPQYNRVQAPYSPTGNSYSPNYNGHPNKFVDQGYQDWNAAAEKQQQQRGSQHGVMSPTHFVNNNNSSGQKYSDGSRIVPIRLEDGHPYLNNGPISQSPTIIQNDSRTTPNQSKSFRVLQQITDTMKNDPLVNDVTHGAELQEPHYSRPIGQNDINENQMRKMRLNDYDPRRQHQDSNQGRFVSPHGYHNEPQQYQQQQNNTVPSRSFKLLQAMTKPENAAADVQAIDIDQELDSFDYYSNYPTSRIPYTVSLPDTPLPSECGDSFGHSVADIVDENDLDDDDIYESCTYDSYHDNSQFQPVAQNVPRIVITPTPEDEAISRRVSLTTSETLNDNRINQNETFALLSSKLNALHRSDTELNTEQHEKLFMGDENKFTNSPSTHSANSSVGDLSNHEITKNCGESYLYSSESESESEVHSDDDMPKSEGRRESSLQAVRSVANIKVYDDEEFELSDDEQDVENSNSRPFDVPSQEFARHEAHESNVELREIDDDSDDNSDDVINFVIDSNHHDDDGNETNASCDLLSVIYEEDDERSTHSKRPATVTFSSSSNSSSTTTLAQDEQQINETNQNSDESSDDDTEEQEPEHGYSENESDNNNRSDDDDDDENSTSVTVRLPLKLSFSRSSNNEDVTTVVVGNSEIEDAGLVESNSDVSVSFSLRRSQSRSEDRSGAHSNRTSVDLSNYQPASFDNDASDSEVSVSLSLPMKKKTLTSPRPFVRQQTLSPVFHAKDNFEYRPWKSIDIEDPIATANVQHHSKTFKPENSFDQCMELPEEEDVMDENESEEKKVSVRDRIASFEVPSIKQTLNDYGRSNFSASLSRSSSTEPESDSESESESEYEHDMVPQNVLRPVVPVQTSIVAPHGYIEIEQNNYKTEEMEFDEQAKHSVREKIASFEAPPQYERPKFDMHKETMAAAVTRVSVEREQSPSQPQEHRVPDLQNKLHPTTFRSLNRNSYTQQSIPDESELDEDDSGVTSDISRRISEETDDTESECFPELRKLTRYERAATHSRLFKLLQQDCENDSEDSQISNPPPNPMPKSRDDDKSPISYKPKKIIHNVSITRKMNPELVKNAETMAERRERLSLNSKQSSSIDADNVSCSSSPTPSTVNEKLIDELVQSVLQQTKRRNLQNIPIDKIQAAARKALHQQQQQHDEFDSCDTAFNSFDSTPALTPHEFREDSFDDCDTWNSNSTDYDRKLPATDILPSKAFKNLQEQSLYGRKRKLWAAKCPRVLSSKTVNNDLCRVTESRESQSPEPSSYYSRLS